MVSPTVIPDDERRSAERRTVHRAALVEMIAGNDQKHDAAHHRMRESVRELEQRCEDGNRLLADKIHAVVSRVDAIERAPVDVSKVMFTPRVVFSIVAVVLSIWVGFWGSTAGLRSDAAADRRVSEANAKLLELNITTIKSAIADSTREMRDSQATTGKRLDLLTLQYNELKDQLTRMSARGEK